MKKATVTIVCEEIEFSVTTSRDDISVFFSVDISDSISSKRDQRSREGE
jgi:hypothetical protein